ncbi:hypothetical protein ACRAWF_18380 [Streptomyces sp. L7]
MRKLVGTAASSRGRAASGASRARSTQPAAELEALGLGTAEVPWPPADS